MITIIYLILTFLGILPFTWWVPFIDGIVESFFAVSTQIDRSSISGTIYTYIGAGISAFSFYSLFCDLSLHPAFIILSGFIFLAAFIVPGGFTMVNLLLSYFGFIVLPKWILTIGIICDILTLILLVYIIYSDYKDKRSGL